MRQTANAIQVAGRRESLSRALALGMPYAASCTATSTEDPTAKPQRTHRVRCATLPTASYAKGK